MDPATNRKSFTGRKRGRTRTTVRIADRIARLVIAGGGIGTIVVVILVCFFLVWEVVPLFKPARVERQADLPANWDNGQIAQLGMDEFHVLGWALLPGGQLHAFRLSDGQEVGKPSTIRASDAKDAAAMTASSLAVDGKHCALGFADGSVRLGTIGFKTKFLEPAAVPPEIRDLAVGKSAEFNGGVIQSITGRQFRLQKLAVELDQATPPVSKSAILNIDFTTRTEGPVFCTRSADGSINVNAVQNQVNMMTDEVTPTVTTARIASLASDEKSPDYLQISGVGDNLIVAWKDGRLIRFDIRDMKKPREVERISLFTDNDRTLTAIRYMLGGATLVAGDSAGGVTAWSPAKPKTATTADHTILVASHHFAPCGSPIAALAASSRSRAIAAGTADGRIRLLYVTSESVLAEPALAQTGSDGAKSADADPVVAVAFAPRGDALLAAGRAKLANWELDTGYPEITLSSLFRPVWYEGAEVPAHSWQSSSGSDAFESKFGLMPLIFGTLKATFYSMLFGAPLALLAAIYTSEFLQPNARARIKPAIEMMASLPSVVLGFLAGLVIAPAVESIVPAILAAAFTVPLTYLTAAYLWQLLPVKRAVRMARWRLIAVFAVTPIGLALAVALGPIAERVLFGGDVKAWLNGRVGSGTPGWFVILLPLSALVTAWGLGRFTARARDKLNSYTRLRAGMFELGKFVAGFAICVALAWGVAALLSSAWLDPLTSIISPNFTAMLHDPRGTNEAPWLIGTYVQRNALIVGVMMGFAIIPIIYTIADDALTSVPAHLRSASLGAGATHWQTAMRIVIPTAMSGLFSALMIGLGRAVGETMIVLMAAGNTPIMDINIFNGFQTLAAVIATELPEAAVDSVHYRTLILAALTLFVMTFFVNTAAEMVRLRFRRRAHEL